MLHKNLARIDQKLSCKSARKEKSKLLHDKESLRDPGVGTTRIIAPCCCDLPIEQLASHMQPVMHGVFS